MLEVSVGGRNRAVTAVDQALEPQSFEEACRIRAKVLQCDDEDHLYGFTAGACLAAGQLLAIYWFEQHTSLVFFFSLVLSTCLCLFSYSTYETLDDGTKRWKPLTWLVQMISCFTPGQVIWLSRAESGFMFETFLYYMVFTFMLATATHQYLRSRDARLAMFDRLLVEYETAYHPFRQTCTPVATPASSRRRTPTPRRIPQTPSSMLKKAFATPGMLNASPGALWERMWAKSRHWDVPDDDGEQLRSDFGSMTESVVESTAVGTMTETNASVVASPARSEVGTNTITNASSTVRASGTSTPRIYHTATTATSTSTENDAAIPSVMRRSWRSSFMNQVRPLLQPRSTPTVATTSSLGIPAPKSLPSIPLGPTNHDDRGLRARLFSWTRTNGVSSSSQDSGYEDLGNGQSNGNGHTNGDTIERPPSPNRSVSSMPAPQSPHLQVPGQEHDRYSSQPPVTPSGSRRVSLSSSRASPTPSATSSISHMGSQSTTVTPSSKHPLPKGTVVMPNEDYVWSRYKLQAPNTSKMLKGSALNIPAEKVVYHPSDEE